MQYRNWIYKNADINIDDVVNYSRENKISPIIVALLFNRGIDNKSEIDAFLSKSMKIVHSPYNLPDMEKAVERIVSAIKNKEKIVIYGDYDVDGITATTILYKYLMEKGADVSYYIPNRLRDGYGINVMAINRLSKDGAKLIISVDCGITSVGEVELARTFGVDVIITDHHQCPEKLPAAVAVVNPSRPDSDYQFPWLAGAGVAFKLVLALSVAFEENTKDVFYKYVMYAAMGTIADVVPLTDENRIIADRGICMLENPDNIGLEALFKCAEIESVDTYTVSFMIAPRLNAMGRIDEASKCVELLTCTDKKLASELAEQLNKTNEKRRDIEEAIYNEAQLMLEDKDYDSKPILVLAHEGWHIGVVGIVASRISQMHYKPCIMICLDNGIGVGSCRSVEGIDIYSALSCCNELLIKFGGHKMAAGLTIKRDDLEYFDQKINEYAKNILKGKKLVPSVSIDCRVKPSSITLATAKMLEKLTPFGAGNDIPVFSMHNMSVVTVMQMGREKNHLKLQIKRDQYIFNCVGFKMGELYLELSENTIVDIAFNALVNTFNGVESLQLRLVDLRIHNS